MKNLSSVQNHSSKVSDSNNSTQFNEVNTTQVVSIKSEYLNNKVYQQKGKAVKIIDHTESNDNIPPLFDNDIENKDGLEGKIERSSTKSTDIIENKVNLEENVCIYDCILCDYKAPYRSIS